jgi:hypothetical protein
MAADTLDRHIQKCPFLPRANIAKQLSKKYSEMTKLKLNIMSKVMMLHIITADREETGKSSLPICGIHTNKKTPWPLVRK